MWIAISALNLAIAVMLGAFGAHGLKARATEAQLLWWQTATRGCGGHCGALRVRQRGDFHRGEQLSQGGG